ncbi:MAG: carboxylating nicotinate-nucleotide diphosphorylase [Bacteroidales bacterium]|nr:carboxylating nicotinate-nucleotide diphosphorylase [Bacteroidales bacterium]
MNRTELLDFIERSLREDIGDGDHSTQACIPAEAESSARLIIKEKCIIAGLDIAREIYAYADRRLKVDFHVSDGEEVMPGTIGFIVTGNARTILTTERFMLNVVQRMSGIATSVKEYTKRLEGFKTRILDTRKTTPGMRFLEKEAVRIGGGENHRMGLYDMIMLKDNHIDYAGGIENAILKTRDYLALTGRNLKVEIEARNIDDVKKILETGGIDRIMLDNFTIEDTRRAVALIAGRVETESSGGINLENIRQYAECGVDYISVGALTHHIRSIDISLKAITGK